ncbi:MAG: type II toxin-antitoxin system PrlF family antitoxin [Azovibrio sp.]
MATTLEAESTLTDRYQTTVPEPIRRVLKLKKRDRIRYMVRPNGEVVLKHATPVEMEDPVLGKFLEFLATDISNHPERLQSMDNGLVSRIQSLVQGVELEAETPPSTRTRRK